MDWGCVAKRKMPEGGDKIQLLVRVSSAKTGGTKGGCVNVGGNDGRTDHGTRWETGYERGGKSEHVLGSWASRSTREAIRKRTSPVLYAIPYPLSYSLPRWALQSSGGEITTLLVLPTTGKVRQMGNVHFPRATNRRNTQSHPRSPMERCCCCCQVFFISDDYETVELFSHHAVSFGCVIVLCVNRASSWIPRFIFLFRPLPPGLLRIYRYYFQSFSNF